MNILITGRPGSGKTTLLNKIRDSLESNGYTVGGVFCPEIRTNNTRAGFRIISIANKREGILSHINCIGPRVGKYKVNLNDLNKIGVPAIKYAIKNSDYIFIDEIAPMELYSKKFIDAVKNFVFAAQKIYDFLTAVENAFDSEKPVLAAINKKSNHPFILDIKNRSDVLIFEISPENRDLMYNEVLNILKKIKFI